MSHKLVVWTIFCLLWQDENAIVIEDMMRQRLYIILTLLLAFFVCLGASASSAELQPRWTKYRIDGVEYVGLRDLCNFYRFKPLKGRSGYVSFGWTGREKRVISIRASHSDFYLNNFRYILSYPVREQGGQLMLSTVDIEKLVDPVLRPKFSSRNSILRTVVIDAGHGGHDAGAVSPYAREKDCNLAVARKLRDLLKRAGFNVVMTRDSDIFLTLRQRVQIANRTPNSIFVSIHHNSGRSLAEGIETFTLAPQGTTSPFARSRRYADLEGNDQDSENIALATAIHSRAIKSSKAVDRGIQRARFSVLCTIERPAILFEGGFVSNAKEGRKIMSPQYQQMLAQSIYEGIVAYGKNVCKSSPVRSSSSRVATRSGGSVRTSIPGSRVRQTVRRSSQSKLKKRG